MTELPDLSHRTHDEKDALIRALWAQVQALTTRVAELEAKLGGPPKTPDNSSLPPSRGKKPNRAEKLPRRGPRPGSLGRMGGGRALAEIPDEIVVARPVQCAHCQAALGEADHILHGHYDKIDLPAMAPVVTRVERYAARCGCCGGTTLAPVPERLELGRGHLTVCSKPHVKRKGSGNQDLAQTEVCGRADRFHVKSGDCRCKTLFQNLVERQPVHARSLQCNFEQTVR